MNVRRSRLINSFIALMALLSGALLIPPSGAQAETATPEIAYEGWFGRSKQDDPVVVIPCDPPTPRGCGPVSPADFPEPRSKSTGAYVVASAGGKAGDSDGEGDTGWAVFQWDLFEFTGATAEKFVVTISQADDNGGRNNGDTYFGTGDAPPMQACNILDSWSSEPGPNPWTTRPAVSRECVPVKVQGRKYTVDATQFAQSWLDGKGFGFVIRPGTPDIRDNLRPFQVTLSGYYDPGSASPGCATNTSSSVPCSVTASAPDPVVSFEYTPAEDEDVFEDLGDDLGGDAGDDLFDDIADIGGDDLAAMPDLDVIPTDVGSGDLGDAPQEEAALPTSSGRTRPISSDTPFPWAILLLLPIAAIAFWGTGTALGPMGDPVPARRGGVSRVLGERHGNGGNTMKTRDR